jgi:O-antigen ligase
VVKRRRWAWHLGFLVATVLALSVFWHSNTSFMTRFRAFFAWDQARSAPLSERKEVIIKAVTSTPRYNMYSGALRAWKTKKLFGIGPGMHQHLWPHFAASPDGDRKQQKRPARLNAHFRSFEVHSDWIQLLEEYGLAGLLLFLAGFVSISAVLVSGMRQSRPDTAVVAGSLAVVGMAFHSLGDFNLQMPATTWLLAAIVATAVLAVVRPEDSGPSEGTSQGDADKE